MYRGLEKPTHAGMGLKLRWRAATGWRIQPSSRVGVLRPFQGGERYFTSLAGIGWVGELALASAVRLRRVAPMGYTIVSE